MKKWVPLLLSIAATNVFSQSPATDIGTFLRTVQEDSVLIMQNQKESFLKKTTAGIPLVDGVQLRLRNQAYRFDTQRYAVRISPRGFGETKARNRICRTDQVFNRQRTLAMMNSLIADRYYLVVDLLYHQTVISLYKDLSVLHEDKIAVLKKQTGSLAFDMNDLIKAEDKLTNLRSEIIMLEKNITLLQRGYNPVSGLKINLNLPTEIIETFDTTGFIPVEVIGDWVKTTTFVLDSNNIYLKRDRLELMVAENEFTLEMAENRRWISFFEFAYDHGERLEELDNKYDGKEYDLTRAYIMSLGFEIPYITRDRYDINRRKLAFLSDKENFLELKSELEYRVKKDAEDILALVIQYAYLIARKNDVNAESSFKRYLEMDGVDPLVLLSLKESIMENDIKIEEIRFNIYRNYIRILDVTGQLSQVPSRNYLARK